MVLQSGESIYLVSTMGHVYVASKGSDDALALGIGSSAAEELMDSLRTLNAEEAAPVNALVSTKKCASGKR